MDTKPNLQELFENRLSYPDPDAQDRLSRLVGLDQQTERLSKMLGLLVNPAGLKVWAKKHHPDAMEMVGVVLRRPPLVILAGDVGSGKTELAETIGDAVAREQRLHVMLLPLSLSTRGQGRVGEMTRLISTAFEVTIEEARKLRAKNGDARGAVILLVDEADALAQSREAAQMHHEDRAGVNAFIRGIDRIANGQLPAAVIMCTNRLTALDPAVRRRAADVLLFERPDNERRRDVLARFLSPLKFTRQQVDAIVEATGANKDRGYGFTFSDIVQRLLPALVLSAYPSTAVDPGGALEIARSMPPTPPFREEQP